MFSSSAVTVPVLLVGVPETLVEELEEVSSGGVVGVLDEVSPGVEGRLLTT